ncbi:MAG: hypothetical protein LBQ28_07775 [Prevotellaceae bacterium]|jgi:hypothetical protein|nr:hypothetical protein [Prevotellaceae bacterium]
MKRLVIILVLIIVSDIILAQTEIQELPLPDTVKFMFDFKTTSPINNSFNTPKSLYPSRLTISHENLYLPTEDSVKQELTDALNNQKFNTELLFVRSAYFTGKSPLFVDINKEKSLEEKINSFYSARLELLRKSIKEITGNVKKVGGIGIGIKTKEERMKERAKTRMTYTY